MGATWGAAGVKLKAEAVLGGDIGGDAAFGAGVVSVGMDKSSKSFIPEACGAGLDAGTDDVNASKLPSPEDGLIV